MLQQLQQVLSSRLSSLILLNTAAIQNNTIGAIDAAGTSATLRSGITGIDTAGAGNFSITNLTL
jgi:hypothetical protein